ncbi:hypothetical protein GCM10011499_10320 [Pelagibacterium lentulum]|uniref:Uncharacterized protein n=1 Tax=Pelagibacterium lentulum TaxID=2029865 RepID=A0A916VVN8_9HYPH|nr:hypothetical protein GCM10011499_10320 [Pelagibacterium lentulum]
MSFLTIKSAEQLDLQALHRARDRLVQSRTWPVNQARAVLMGRGIRVSQGRHTFQRALADLNHRIGAFDDEITALAESDPTILNHPGFAGGVSV